MIITLQHLYQIGRSCQEENVQIQCCLSLAITRRSLCGFSRGLPVMRRHGSPVFEPQTGHGTSLAFSNALPVAAIWPPHPIDIVSGHYVQSCTL